MNRDDFPATVLNAQYVNLQFQLIESGNPLSLTLTYTHPILCVLTDLGGEGLSGSHRSLPPGVEIHAQFSLARDGRSDNVNYRQARDAHHLRRLESCKQNAGAREECGWRSVESFNEIEK